MIARRGARLTRLGRSATDGAGALTGRGATPSTVSAIVRWLGPVGSAPNLDRTIRSRGHGMPCAGPTDECTENGRRRHRQIHQPAVLDEQRLNTIEVLPI